jgi:propanediol utilization protein
MRIFAIRDLIGQAINTHNRFCPAKRHEIIFDASKEHISLFCSDTSNFCGPGIRIGKVRDLSGLTVQEYTIFTRKILGILSGGTAAAGKKTG